MPSTPINENAAPAATESAAQGAPASAWAGGPPESVRAALAIAATPPPGGTRLANGSSANATPGGSVRVASGSGSGAAAVDLAALKALIDESINRAVGEATAPLHQELGAIKQRLSDAESRASDVEQSSDDADDDDDDDEGDEDDEIDAIVQNEGTYLAVDAKSNKHFGAADVANHGDFQPKRKDLYGHRPWMVLTKGGNDTGGILGLALSYAEPLSLFGKAAADASEHLAEEFAAGVEDPERFLRDLVAVRNTQRELYRMCNLFRSIIVQKARALRPGATAYDKAEVQYLERALHERDFATADTAGEIASLRALFAKRSNKSELERLAKKGGGGGGGGGRDDGGSDGGSDSDASSSGRRSRNKKKRDKAKQRKRDAKQREGQSNGRTVGGGGDTRRDGGGTRDRGDSSSSRSSSAAGGGERSHRGGGGKGKQTRTRDAASREQPGRADDDDEAGFE